MSDTNNDLFWHALNYRTASTENAEAMWHELMACVGRYIDPLCRQLVDAKSCCSHWSDVAESYRQQLAESQAREKVLRNALEILYDDNQWQEAYNALMAPRDSTALDSAIAQAEERVEATYKVELDLLREIGEILEPVEYLGSYADGIKAAIRQAKRELAQEVLNAPTQGHAENLLRRMTDELKG